MDFNVTEYEKFPDTVLDSTVQLTLMKPLVVKSGYSVKEYPQLIWKGH